MNDGKAAIGHLFLFCINEVDSDMSESKAWIAGTSGLKLTPDEIAFFRDERPWGFILFARNISEAAQIEDLTAHCVISCGVKRLLF